MNNVNNNYNMFYGSEEGKHINESNFQFIQEEHEHDQYQQEYQSANFNQETEESNSKVRN